MPVSETDIVSAPSALGTMKAQRIFMIYDAPSGPLAAMLDSAKKLFGMGCKLCTITHGMFGKREEWADFEKKVGTEVDYLHSDELGEIEKKMGQKLALPCILVELENGNYEVLLSHIMIKALENPDVERLTAVMRMWADNMGIEI